MSYEYEAEGVVRSDPDDDELEIHDGLHPTVFSRSMDLRLQKLRRGDRIHIVVIWPEEGGTEKLRLLEIYDEGSNEWRGCE